MQVFAFVRSDSSNDSPHRAECHVCESSLEFRTKVEVLELHISVSILMNSLSFENAYS